MITINYQKHPISPTADFFVRKIMRYLSVCSGIEAASVAWHDLDFQPVGFSEIEPFPSAVLKYRYPNVTNFGDMTKFKEWDIKDGTVELVVGGTPCQSFSVAGLRKGLEDPRGNLCLTFLAILERFKPRWFIWENVPGVFSSNKGDDFKGFLQAANEIGYSASWRVLDAQYFGVAQRRRRVFVVGYFGDWQNPAKVLFEQESLHGDITKIEEQGQDPTAETGREFDARCFSAAGFGEVKEDSVTNTITTENCSHIRGDTPLVLNSPYLKVAKTLMAGVGKLDPEVETYVPVIHGTQDPIVSNNKAHCLGRNNGQENVVAIVENIIGRSDQSGGNGVGVSENIMYTLTTVNPHAVQYGMHVRRLTPIECERLQGFPDKWTNIPYRNKLIEDCPDSPRYKAIGNSMAVPVMTWIGERILMVEKGIL